ncbi:FCS-Like Zinc finger 10-like [Phragmites australis]|uniref:FCS-Like Zinc finger 10-like n=1 Tax=Phragmites australis TaxID=29695 RepID=UPI002D79268B|nr:FCS-Like Zinc finger 10-like [Phragmites australis]XP_062198963.1 FCS-Like Zinc finger 10-like [Phragmites australis]XP_062199707.1 FCS-Like Zinc finger 10-like [Phragmites australis]
MLRRMVSDPAPDSSGRGWEARPRGGAALFAVPRLFVGLAPKRAPDGESSRSPTSPLDPKALLLRSPRSPRTWDAEPLGRGLVDALASDANNCLLSPRLRLKSYSSLPKDGSGGGHSQPELGKTMSCPAPDTAAGGVMSVPCSRFFHGDLKSGPEATQSDGIHLNNPKRHSFDLGKLPGPGSLASIAAGARRFIGSVSASEIEQSEDYTRIIARGPNPKTTHIFGDCILEPLTVGESDETAMEVKEGASESYWVVKCAAEAAAREDFLSSCFTCKKKLEGNDIYIYRGEKAFCSANCRDQEILIEEEAENNNTSVSPRSSRSSFHDDIFMAGMVVAT